MSQFMKDLLEHEKEMKKGQDVCRICMDPMPPVRKNKNYCSPCLMKSTFSRDPVTRQKFYKCPYTKKKGVPDHKNHPFTPLCGYLCNPAVTVTPFP